ncbi:VWA domain-containing protein [Nocardia otitidiscaviarum]|uniref:VWA domain-containing protein n=1 Tax=Nocardia otitidiscaviarum TaxID=1823 RepID=UPI0018956594|nr:VWA domain-containing protein [Nocardia otitidiscaviarum]MBF6183352.1 VWA domain-containing protein [Nocardia otitidiscaviarum]
MTASHVTAAPTAPAPIPPALSDWLDLSHAMTAETPAIADRADLTVVIAPGAAAGELAMFVPDHKMIAIEGLNLGVDPGTARPWRYADRNRYAPTWGALTHECAHARHTRWTPPPATAPDVAAAAMLLEEARIEAAQLRRRPADRHWLRASTRALVFADSGGELAAATIAPTRHAAAHAAALMLARIDAGVLKADECAPAAAAIANILGRDLLRQLRTLWRIAHRLSDTNTTGMLELGRRWTELLGPEPHTTPQPNSPLGEAVTGSLDELAERVAAHALPPDSADLADQAASDEAMHTDRADTTAKQVFGKRTDPGSRRPMRAPHDDERIAARVLARALNTASQRERAITKTTSALPPGRLRMRGALARDAQRAAGAIPTAEPFTRTTRKSVPVPPLRIGIACDVSGSMSDYTDHVASAAWIIATAAKLAAMPAETATLTFGREVLPVTYPGTAPAKVTEFAATAAYEAADIAIDALDGALGLSRPENTRLLVIISDGCFQDQPRAAAQQRVNRLRETGCAVLWLAPDEPWSEPLSGVTVHALANPADTIAAIARTAVTAVRTA